MIEFLQDGLGFFFLDSGACFNDIDNLVIQLFTFVDDVHIDGAYRIRIFMAVNAVDILCLELVSVVVDFIFQIEGGIDIQLFMMAAQESIHELQ